MPDQLEPAPARALYQRVLNEMIRCTGERQATRWHLNDLRRLATVATAAALKREKSVPPVTAIREGLLDAWQPRRPEDEQHLLRLAEAAVKALPRPRDVEPEQPAQFRRGPKGRRAGVR